MCNMWCAITIDCSSSGLWISIYMKRWRGYMYLPLINSRIWKPIRECINIEISKRNMTSTQPVQLHQRQGLNERFAKSSWLGWCSSVVACWSLTMRPYKVQAPHRPKGGKGREPIYVGEMRRLILADNEQHSERALSMRKRFLLGFTGIDVLRAIPVVRWECSQ